VIACCSAASAHRAGPQPDVVVPFIEHLIGVQFLAKDVYYISELPSDLRYDEVLLVSGISFLISLLATLYRATAHRRPSRRRRCAMNNQQSAFGGRRRRGTSFPAAT